MKDDLTNDDLDEILNRCNGTTVGPWKSYVEGRDHEAGSNFIMTGNGEFRGEDIELNGATVQDQDFIASAKQDIPRLVNEIKRLRDIRESGS